MPNTVIEEVQEELIISDFRQNGPPEPSTDARHWLVDDLIGRELLANALRVARPDLDVPMILGSHKNFDAELNGMVPGLGLENLAKPETPWQDLKTSWFLMRRTTVLEFAELRKAFASKKCKEQIL